MLRKSPGGAFLRSLVLVFVFVCASSGDRTVVFVVCGVLFRFRFRSFSYHVREQRLLARSKRSFSTSHGGIKPVI
jgi:hypothetical protein